MKRIFTRTLAAVLCAAMTTAAVSADSFTWSGFRGNEMNNGVVSQKTPDSADGTVLYWAKKVGSGWTDAPSSVTIVDDAIVYASGSKLYKMDKETGEVQGVTGELAAGTSYSMIPPCYADGVIYMGLAGGTIQAFDADTMASLWVYTDPLGGQPNSPVTYKDGHIYTGFWNSETGDANFVCIDSSDEDPNNPSEAKNADWTYTQAGGFYWAGAYAGDGFVVVGTDDGKTDSYSSTGRLIVFNPSTGEKLDEVTDIYGDVRSSIVYDETSGNYCFTSKGGVFYSFKIDGNGKITDRREIILNGTNDKTVNPKMSTASPCVVDGRAYIAVSGKSQWGKYSGSGIMVIDLETMSIAYTAETMAYAQASGLVSTGYKDKDGYNYVYFIENTNPSEIRYIKDKKGVNSVIDPSVEVYNGEEHICAPVLFTPVGAQAQYAISSLICDDEGTFYFKNDSSYIMAVGSKIESIYAEGRTLYKEGEVISADDITVTALLSNGETRDVTLKTTFSDQPLTTDDFFTTLICNYALYGDRNTANGHETGAEAEPAETVFDIKVLSEDDYNSVINVINLIDNIGEVTLESGDKISEARTAYDALDDRLKADVSNYSELNRAEDEYAGLSGAETSSREESSMTQSGDSGISAEESSFSSSGSDTSKASSYGSESSKANNNNYNSNPATGARGFSTLAFLTVLSGAMIAIRRKK